MLQRVHSEFLLSDMKPLTDLGILDHERLKKVQHTSSNGLFNLLSFSSDSESFSISSPASTKPSRDHVFFRPTSLNRSYAQQLVPVLAASWTWSCRPSPPPQLHQRLQVRRLFPHIHRSIVEKTVRLYNVDTSGKIQYQTYNMIQDCSLNCNVI